MKKKIQKLPKEFIGGGEVHGFNFKQVFAIKKGYIYEVNDEGKIHYEAFENNVVQCTNVEMVKGKMVVSSIEGSFKETYPRSNGFGIRAWTCRSLESAKLKLK